MLKHFLQKKIHYFIRPFLYRSTSIENVDVIFNKIYNDPWPGDFAVAQNFIHGHFDVGHKVLTLADFMNALTVPDLLDNQTLLFVHSFDWIRDLRCLSDNMSRRLTRQFIDQWISNNSQWNKKMNNSSLEPHLTGCRLSNWISTFDFFGSSADEDFLNRFKKSLIFQFNNLNKRYTHISDPLQKMMAIKGCIFAASVLDPIDLKIQQYIESLKDVLSKQILPDGGHISRDPVVHLYVLKDLVDIRSLMRFMHYKEDDFLTECIQKMVPIVRLFRHGDGTLADFTSSKMKLLPKHARPNQTYIDMVLSIADVKGRPPSKAPDMGFERLNTKSGQLIINTKPQIELRERFFGPGTGVLNFEWGLGKNKLIQKGDVVIQTQPNHWVQVSTQKDVPQVIKLDRQIKEGKIFFEGDFESVISPRKQSTESSLVFNHQRQIYLGGEEGDFRGQDRMLISTDSLCAIRFIFAKNVDVTLPSNHNTLSAVVRVEESDQSTFKKNDKSHFQLWRFLSSNIEELSVHRDDLTGQTALLLVQNLKIDKPHIIKWAFHLMK
jgi:hypothetical protein